ncbi:MAG: AAA family ATPase, partial [Pseudanabaena sp. CRU_2_10]|nr:AAA family ATPase [Pseudanabaena sp. CRU_2_10]
MKVKQLKIKAFRGIQDLTLEFDQNQPTVLIGINGAGKSSALDCLAVLLSHFIGQLRVSMSYNHLKGDAAQYFTELDINTLSKETYAEVSIIDDEQTVAWSITKQRGQASTRPKIARELRLATDNLSDPFYSGLAPKLTLIVYYPVNRIVIDIPLDVPKEYQLEHAAQMHAYDWAVSNEKVDFVEFFRWFRLVEDIENETRLSSNPDYRDYQLQSVRRAITS